MRTSKRLFWTAAWMILALPLILAGCGDEGADGPPPQAGGAADKQYEVQGRVVEVAPDGRTVTLDHEDIPGLMKGMEMKFTAEDPAMLEGIEAGDQVQGGLVVRDGNYIITELKKR